MDMMSYINTLYQEVFDAQDEQVNQPQDIYTRSSFNFFFFIFPNPNEETRGSSKRCEY